MTPGASGLARAVLGLSLSGTRNPAPGAGVAMGIAVNNVFRGSWPLALGPLGAAGRRVTRACGDLAVAGNVLVCAALVGAAVGGYGLRTLAFLAHVPLEWAGVAAGVAGWLVERRGPLRGAERGWWVCMLVGLFGLAAIVETWLAPHG
jgi:hypothetical protein